MLTKLEVNLLNGNIIKGLVIFAIPLFISNIFQQLYNTVDTMIVSNILGESSLAAIGSSSPIYDLLIGFALGVGNGLGVVTARAFGSKNYDLVKKNVAGSIVIGIILSCIIMIISQFFLIPLLTLLNTPSEIIQESYSYIHLITLFVFVMFAYNLCSGLMRATGNSLMPLIFLIISSLLNIFFDYLFIADFGLGIRGAAIGTILAQAISVVLCLLYIKRKSNLLVPRKKDFNINKKIYRELIGQGMSMGLMMSIVSTGTVILQSAINGLGYLVIAGHTAARKISTFAVMPCSTISSSISTFVSQNKGANQYERIKKGVRYSNYIAIVWGVFASLIMILFSEYFIEFITGSNNPIIILNGSNYLKINAPFYVILGILLNLRHALQGLGRKIVPLISSVIECIGKILFVLIFIPFLGYFGVIICEPVIWGIMCLQLAVSFYSSNYLKKEE